MKRGKGPPPRPVKAPPGKLLAKQPIAQKLAAGVAHHNAGRLAEAEAAYRAVLAAEPGNPDASHLLGVIAMQVGKPEVAVELIGQAIAHNAATRNAANPAWHANLGMALRRLGRLDEALEACRRAVALDANFIDGYNNLANVAFDKGLHLEAADALKRLLAARPQLVDQRLLLARALILGGRAEEALSGLEELLRRQPRLPAVYVNLGVALRKLERDEEAVAIYRRGLEIAPEEPALLSNLGTALETIAPREEALALFDRAVKNKPDFIDAHINRGVALRDLNRLDESIAASREALRLQPDSATARTNLGHALLLQGKLEEGFTEYEWRLRLPDFPSPTRDFPVPAWRGEPLAGMKLFVHDEQGVGDSIHFVRYMPMLKAAGAEVTLDVNSQLVRLFQGLAGPERVVSRFSPVPPFDRHVSLLSVPRLLRTTIDSVPAEVPYLKPEPGLVAAWKEKLAGAGVKVALVWAGSPDHRNDRNRSLTLEALAPLGAVPGARLFSVQKGPASAQLANPPAGLEIRDLGPDIGDFADTAAILSEVDLLISCDTSVAHLAGALARPVWVFVPFAPDWRWLMEREDTPWYPTMRLFRQTRPGQWGDVVARVADALKEVVGKAGAGKEVVGTAEAGA